MRKNIIKFSKIRSILFIGIFVPIFFYANSSKSEDSKAVINKVQPDSKVIIKAVEQILLTSIVNSNVKKMVHARIDTGATQSSMDSKLAKELGFTKTVGHVNVISANGIKKRALVEVDYELSGKKIKSTFSIADRSSLNYSVLIGRNDLRGFLIDPIDY